MASVVPGIVTICESGRRVLPESPAVYCRIELTCLYVPTKTCRALRRLSMYNVCNHIHCTARLMLIPRYFTAPLDKSLRGKYSPAEVPRQHDYHRRLLQFPPITVPINLLVDKYNMLHEWNLITLDRLNPRHSTSHLWVNKISLLTICLKLYIKPCTTIINPWQSNVQ